MVWQENLKRLPVAHYWNFANRNIVPLVNAKCTRTTHKNNDLFRNDDILENWSIHTSALGALGALAKPL